MAVDVGGLRKPFFVAALVLILLVVLVEIGALGVLGGAGEQVASLGALIPGEGDLRDAFEELDEDELEDLLSQDKPPGIAIPYLALLDGLVLFTVALMGVSLLLRERIHARIQGCATLIAMLLLVLGAIIMIIVAILAVTLMVSLFLAFPFGTLTYLAIYGFFNRPGANVVLGLLMALRIGFAICLVVAHQRYLQNKGLVLLIITSFLGNVIVSFLHALVPIFLVSILDGIAAIIAAILAVIWGIVLLVGSVISVIKALRVDRV